MANPIATKNGICFAFPDILLTPAGPSMVPMPYPNIAQLSSATGEATNVNAGGKPVILKDSKITSSSGGEPGTGKGVTKPFHLGECTFTKSSNTVKANGKGIVRQFDTTDQNGGNAKGQVMVGFPTVLVGD
jgi:Domain of unknown function (DUF4150)